MDNGAFFFGILIILAPVILVLVFIAGPVVFALVFVIGGAVTVGIGGLVSRIRDRATVEGRQLPTTDEDDLSVLTEVTPPR